MNNLDAVGCSCIVKDDKVEEANSSLEETNMQQLESTQTEKVFKQKKNFLRPLSNGRLCAFDYLICDSPPEEESDVELSTPSHAELSTPSHTELLIPGHTELSNPGQTELSTPGHAELSTPGHTDLSTPGYAELSTPGPADLSTPIHTELSTPGHTELSTPGHAELSTPGTGELSITGHCELSTRGHTELSHPGHAEIDLHMEPQDYANDNTEILNPSENDCQKNLNVIDLQAIVKRRRTKKRDKVATAAAWKRSGSRFSMCFGQDTFRIFPTIYEESSEIDDGQQSKSTEPIAQREITPDTLNHRDETSIIDPSSHCRDCDIGTMTCEEALNYTGQRQGLLNTKLMNSTRWQRAPSHLTITPQIFRKGIVEERIDPEYAHSEDYEHGGTFSDESLSPIDCHDKYVPSSECAEKNTTHEKYTKDINASVENGDDSDILLTSCIECVKAVPVTSGKQIKFGDHIVFPGKIYDHHGIVVKTMDDGKKFEIIEATNTAIGAAIGAVVGGKAKIISSVHSFDFARQRIWVVIYRKRIFPREQVVKNAFDFKAGKVEKFKYNLFENNCEHFATYCVTGKKLSVQVEKINLTKNLFFSSGFQGMSDENLRNENAFKNKMLCEHCYQRNVRLLSVHVTPIKTASVLPGDIIRFSYYKLWHQVVVLAIIDIQRSYLTCKIAHYKFRGLFSHRMIEEDDFKIEYDDSCWKLEYGPPEYDVYEPEEVVKRARSRLGEKLFVFYSNDSAHFTRWCKLKQISQRNADFSV